MSQSTDLGERSSRPHLNPANNPSVNANDIRHSQGMIGRLRGRLSVLCSSPPSRSKHSCVVLLIVQLRQNESIVPQILPIAERVGHCTYLMEKTSGSARGKASAVSPEPEGGDPKRDGGNEGPG